MDILEQNKHTPSPPITSDSRHHRQGATQNWFAELRDKICATIEAIEAEYATSPHAKTRQANPATFTYKKWHRQTDSAATQNKTDTGGGSMAILHGGVFEKIGVNISTVHGSFPDSFRQQIPGCRDTAEFWASGISLVAHPHNPFVPAVHFNTRYLQTGGASPHSKRWFGGGADLTPMLLGKTSTTATQAFHAALQAGCDRHHPDYYQRFKGWCDDYFTLKHRGEKRGTGGIFYDYLPDDDFDGTFAFARAVGETFLEIYPSLVRQRLTIPFSEDDRHQQLLRRGRYVEFNLLYDRGTIFGLNTGGNVEAILMSLPPLVRWA
ncbi:MAG: oxygen-dependent coproporphyrinogen oxidase [Proteobacteria bacterium]|nr:oxygen-dependent coproporphyrinogen oxidase [Pseudomonadota bacterium]